jgi:hypothetical protein
MRQLRWSLAIVVAGSLLLAGSALAQQEHPQEHPKKDQKEHPAKEHPTAKPVTTGDIEKAIRAHVEAMSKKNNGSFPVKDDVLKKTWALTLDRVHTDKLTQLDANTSFACVDFNADDGTKVDVDFFLKSKGDKLEVTDTSVHKINGVARYNYEQDEGGFWKRVGTSEAKKEHPKGEHPKKQ